MTTPYPHTLSPAMTTNDANSNRKLLLFQNKNNPATTHSLKVRYTCTFYSGMKGSICVKKYLIFFYFGYGDQGFGTGSREILNPDPKL